MRYQLLICLFVTCVSGPIAAQTVLHAQDITEGLVVVILPDKNRKLAALQKLLDQPDLAQHHRRRTEQQIEQTKITVAEQQAALKAGFEEEFEMAPVAYINQAHSAAFEATRQATLLLDSSGNTYRGKVPAHIIYAEVGYFNTSGNERHFALQMRSPEQQTLAPNLPTHVRLGGILALFSSEAQNIQRGIRILNNRLKRALQKGW